ncbi:MAG: cytochrome c maturation protein CcmE [Planctomycetota bacterium]|nr:cytochrome c maturation protein CcmE [Planctomycetota bacterium]
MISSHKKAIVAGLILAAAGGYLLYAGVKAGKLSYLTVEEFLADKSFRTQRVRLRGMVSKEELSLRAGSATVSFWLVGEKGGKLRVSFSGTIPDTFAADREVVVEGTLGKDDVFLAGQLLTKCASKYEGDKGPGGRRP